MRRTLCFIIGLLSLIYAFSQKVENVTASFTYYAPETMSVEEAKRAALEGAKIEAIATKFGTNVSQHTTSFMSNKDDEFYLFADTDVKGEWIETTGEPKYDISYKDKTLIVTCTVKGKAREIVSAGINFVAKPLRNGTELKFEGYDFKDGDDLYLYFQAPVDGFLAIYLLDEASQTVYNILPYKSQNISAIAINANKEYIFFSKRTVERGEKGSVDEYTLSCENPKEYNTLYILFSQSEIGKRTGFDSSIEDKPDNISYKDFKQWLSKTLSKDKKLQFQELHITISK